MDFQKNMAALGLMEHLLNNGCSWDKLPISSTRAKAIATMEEDVTDSDLQALSMAVSEGGAH